MGKCCSLSATAGMQDSNMQSGKTSSESDPIIEHKRTDEINVLTLDNNKSEQQKTETKQQNISVDTVTEDNNDVVRNEAQINALLANDPQADNAELKQQIDELKEKLDKIEDESKQKDDLIMEQNESMNTMYQQNILLQMHKDHIDSVHEKKIAELTSENKEIEANIMKCIEDTTFKLPMKYVLTQALQSDGYYVWEWRITENDWTSYNEGLSKSIERLIPGQSHTYSGSSKNSKMYTINKESKNTGTEYIVSLSFDKDAVKWPCRKSNKFKYKYQMGIGTEITIEEIKGNNIRISSPMKGWIPFKHKLQLPSLDTVNSKSGQTKISIMKTVLQIGDVIAIHLLDETNWNVRSAMDRYYNTQYDNDTKNIQYSLIWQWMNDNSDWKVYTEEQMTKINSLQTGGVYKFVFGNHNYKFVKKSDIKGEQINLKSNKTRQARRIKVKKVKDVKYPKLWSNDGVIGCMYHDFDQKGAELHYLSSDNIPIEENYLQAKRIEIDLNLHEAQDITSTFYSTADRKTFLIFKIESVQNRYLWDKYYAAKRSLKKSIGKHKLNERYLWHGTKVATVQTIITQGFRKEFNYKTVWGEGTYFAANAGYSVQYCSSHGSKYEILYCSVLCGEERKGSSNIELKNWPVKPDGSGQIYDCLVNSKSNPTIYVIHDDIRAYPMFIVHFLQVNS